MRDLIDKLTYIAEARTLDPGTIKKYPQRFKKFIDMIRTGEPFYNINQEPVVADPEEADRFQELYDIGKFSGSLKLRLNTGEELPLNKLLKTSELGGQASKGGEGEDTGKETALLKPSQIGITDKDIPASKLGDAIVNNDVLNSTDYGRVVVEMAKTIMQGANPVIPNEVPTKVRDSIIDYAGEYLGVLALVYGTSDFPKKDGFEEWLGGSISDLTLFFPGKANVPLADSFAMIKNKKTQHAVNISSKGKGGGAAPSLSSLKISDEIRNNPDYAGVVGFIDLCNGAADLPTPKTTSQIFATMNLIHEYAPEKLPKKFDNFLPWNVAEVSGKVDASVKAFKDGKNLQLTEYSELWDDFKGDASKSSDGGKLSYVTKLAVMNAVNEGKALPNFQEVVLAILDMNFVQQYADYESKTKTLKFSTQWPAKLEGKITLESKSGATDPSKGGFSFKLAKTEAKTKLEMPDEMGRSAQGIDDTDFAKKADDIALGKNRDTVLDKTPSGMGNPGRKKR
jgi:hypothetical protein